MSKKPKGFGDTLAGFIEITGAKKAFNTIQKARGKEKEDCGCNKRQEKLNKLFPYRK
tara:strand:+ start:319 stop:489 length:171 start_codon:yes stop_codon:yes gene_type:complete